MKSRRTDITELKGQTLVSCNRLKSYGVDEIIFTTTNKKTYRMYHSPDCCESVEIEDICGNLQDLVGSPILQAEESTSNENPSDVTPPKYQDSFTWTFYRLATAKGFVTIRWYGESNGYYSESVDFEELFT
jgi:hypothetical protein